MTANPPHDKTTTTTDDEERRGPGRPPKKLDEQRILSLASNMCTMEEIGADQGCSVDTLERNFAEVIERGRELAKLSLRAKQFQLAMGRPGIPAEYLRDEAGKLIFDEKKRPILVRREVEEIRPHAGMLYWLGKNYLNQSDRVTWEQGDGFEFVAGKK